LQTSDFFCAFLWAVCWWFHVFCRSTVMFWICLMNLTLIRPFLQNYKTTTEDCYRDKIRTKQWLEMLSIASDGLIVGIWASCCWWNCSEFRARNYICQSVMHVLVGTVATLCGVCAAEFSSVSSRASCSTDPQVQWLRRGDGSRHVRPQDRQTMDTTHTSRQGSSWYFLCVLAVSQHQ